jgi:dihydropyrimidinase
MFGRDAPFNKIPMGLPGLETRLALLFSHGVVGGRLSKDGPETAKLRPQQRIEERIRKFVEVSCSNPAKLYGMYPRKGAIALGSDADFVIWDPEREALVTKVDEPSFLHDDLDYTPYEGVRLRGIPVRTFLRGKQVFRRGDADEDIIAAPEGTGLWIPCGQPNLLAWQSPEGDTWPSEEDPVLRRAAKIVAVPGGTGCI